MPSTCPSCGSEMEFSERSVILRTGTCPSCAKEFAYVEGTTLSSHLPRVEEGSSATPVGAPIVVEEEVLECAECGGSLRVRPGRPGALVTVCEDCDRTTTYRAVNPRGGPEETRERGKGPRSGPPPGRPCRKCGAPLRFTTGEDGLLVGECDSCGNRFTLPPRSGPPRRGDYGGRGRETRPAYRDRAGSRPFYRGRGGRKPSTFRDSNRRADDESDDGDYRRRRRRTER